MTITALIKQLEQLKAKYGGRIKVSANARGMLKAHNDVFDIVDVKVAEYSVIDVCDGDGFAEYDSRGREKSMRCIVLGYYPLSG